MIDLTRRNEMAIEIIAWLRSKYQAESPEDITSACRLVYVCLTQTLEEMNEAEKEKEE